MPVSLLIPKHRFGRSPTETVRAHPQRAVYEESKTNNRRRYPTGVSAVEESKAIPHRSIDGVGSTATSNRFTSTKTGVYDPIFDASPN